MQFTDDANVTNGADSFNRTNEGDDELVDGTDRDTWDLRVS